MHLINPQANRGLLFITLVENDGHVLINLITLLK